jgi:hypothetical protein
MKFLKNTSVLALLSIVSVILVACGGTVEAKLGGTLSSLSGGTVVLTNTVNGDTVSVSANGSFTFPAKLASNSAYNVIVTQNPSAQTCSVTNGSGTISQNGTDVDNVQVACQAGSNVPVPVCVTVVGLSSTNSVVLQLNNFTSHPLTVPANQSQSLCFSDQLTPGTAFVIMVVQQPNNPPQNCPQYPGAGNSATVPSSGNASAIITCT